MGLDPSELSELQADVSSSTTGNIYYVDSGAAVASDEVGAGRSPSTPFATIDFAIGQCTANNGDVIYGMPGHAEAVIAAGGLDVDVAGISIIGLGVGNNRPTITLGTDAAADVDGPQAAQAALRHPGAHGTTDIRLLRQ